ncbi:hypothetical protein QAD02_023862 [Eretmocerus hayati]|uniref:Uncharacterized protein n=1 Tax=Eretmocerus hayati TaxID=131215 RepID=A0ACC2PXF0_9HYME|nr:hypothetical protein QAD02_023862 [Eretmocerus hayati]
MDPRQYLRMEQDDLDDLLDEAQHEFVNFLDETFEAFIRDEIRAHDDYNVGFEYLADDEYQGDEGRDTADEADSEQENDVLEEEKDSGFERDSGQDDELMEESEGEDWTSRVVPRRQPRTISTSDEVV